MNRYDYYTRCVNFDEQEWLTEELYYPEPENDIDYDDSYTSSYYDTYDIVVDLDDDSPDGDEDDSEYAFDAFYSLSEDSRKDKEPYRESPDTDTPAKGGAPA